MGQDAVDAAARACVREAVHVRLSGLPAALDPRPCPLRPPLSRLGCAQLHRLVAVTGTVVRTGSVGTRARDTG
jgi:hypothetical protein